ncbi:MAG: RluA family pseudouridine synthase [Bacteroidota bacterium]
MPFEVLFLDNHLLVVVKPAGLLAQADHTGDDDLLTLGKAFLKERFDKPGNVFLGLVHRLDRPVSGVMVLARTSKAASRLSQQFRDRTPTKRYLALVEGTPPGPSGERVDFLAKTYTPGRGSHVKVVPQGHPDGKRAVLRWQTLASERGRSLVEVALLTGRAHQIRVQLAALGTPIVGDLRYGARTEHDGQNLALHSYALAFEHPVRRDPRRFTAPPPATWTGSLAEQARMHVAAEAG